MAERRARQRARGTARDDAARAGALGLLLLALLPALADMASLLPPASWRAALLLPDPDSVREAVFGTVLLPRIAMSLLAGAALGLAGALMQTALRNPLASPDTLGVSAGAQLALAVATLRAPSLLSLGRDVVALGGGTLAAAAALLASSRARLAPASMVLAGLAVGLWCAALATVLGLLHAHVLAGLFVWGAGALDQLGWSGARALAWRLAVAIPLAAVLVRPLAALELDDAAARALGVGVGAVRLLALLLAVGLGASVTSLVGVVGFVGLGAPALVRMAGGVTVGARLRWAPVAGAALLLLTDEVVRRLPEGASVPTGAVTALAGAPLLVLLLCRLGPEGVLPAVDTAGWRVARPMRMVLLLWLLLPPLAAAATLVGAGGWSADAALLLWRAPRVAAAGAAGAMLGVAGLVLQRLLANPAAGPEVLGVGVGAAAGMVAALLCEWPGPGGRLGGGLGGAGLVLALLLALGRRDGFAPGRMLLAGVALASAFQAGLSLLLANGDPRAAALLATLSGSTYGVTAPMAAAAVLAAVAGGAAALCLHRPLDVLPLGEATVLTLGLPLAAVRLGLLVLAAVLTAAATALVGPLTFAGLLAPQLARLLGLRRAGAQLGGTAALGALVLMGADWLGRTAIFPYEVPAGLVAALLGGPGLLWLLRR